MVLKDLSVALQARKAIRSRQAAVRSNASGHSPAASKGIIDVPGAKKRPAKAGR